MLRRSVLSFGIPCGDLAGLAGFDPSTVATMSVLVLVVSSIATASLMSSADTDWSSELLQPESPKAVVASNATMEFFISLPKRGL